MSKDDLIALIEQAFADTIYSSHQKLTNHATWEDREIAREFQGKHWKSLTDVKFLRHYYAALSLLNDAAFRFYLPAFMLAALKDPTTADVILDGLEFNLSPPAPQDTKVDGNMSSSGHSPMDYWPSRVTRFSQDQKKAIKMYLEFYFQAYQMAFSALDEQQHQRILQFWQTFEG